MAANAIRGRTLLTCGCQQELTYSVENCTVNALDRSIKTIIIINTSQFVYAIDNN